MDELNLIKERVNIVDLIQEYLPLKKAGVNFKANCPFHGEKTPSFVVSPERGIWHCFGCGKGGDAFKFLMEKEGLEFKDALEILAQKAGVELKKGKREKGKGKGERFFEINEKAAQFYHYLLTEHGLGKKALEYLHKRGLTDETLKEFGLGYAPLSWDSLVKFLKKREVEIQEMIEVGLVVASQKGGYDRFRGRIMFPLKDIRNRIIGFSGRILDKGEPKYINTPQTEIFDKSKLLFGFNLSKGSIRQKDAAILVEGEMDMILSYQSGVKNIVASKGTALTEGQIESLKKYTQTLLLCFDTDLAGDNASRRGIEMADRAGFNIKVIQVKGGKDPAEVCLADVGEWKREVAEAVGIYDYYLDSASKRYDTKSAQGKRGLFDELLPIWQRISDPLVKEHYIQRLAALLQVKDDLIRNRLAKSAQKAPQAVGSTLNKKDEKLPVRDRRKLLEEYLVALNLHIPVELTYVPDFPETLFTEENLKQVYVLLVLYLDSIAFKGVSFRIGDFIKTVPDELVSLVDRLYLMELDEKLDEGAVWQKEVNMVKQELKKMLLKASLEKLSLQIKSAQEFDKMDTLVQLNKRFRDLSVRLKNL